MWFIQSDMLARVLLAAVAFSLFVRCSQGAGLKKLRPVFSALLSLGVLTLFSPRLALFYVAYIAATYLMLRLMGRLRRGRRPVFVLMCVIFVAPFLAWRLIDIPALLGIYMLAGFSYNMLKAVDALFYVYYADVRISAVSYANFILFFPVFTAGPIFRYRDFAGEFENLRPAGLGEISAGVRRFITGMFKKVVLMTLLTAASDRLALLTEYRWYTSALVIVLAYVSLYVDLSGYSDMAVGLGRVMGVTVPENFKKPWTAPSFTQFWRKWHVTLSDWIREHIFVVAQGKALNKYQSALIGMITMIVMSLWHEFSLITLIGGVYMGLFLVIENIFSLSTFNVRKEKKYKYVIRCVLVNLFFALNALTFSMNLDKILAVLKGLVRI